MRLPKLLFIAMLTLTALAGGAHAGRTQINGGEDIQPGSVGAADLAVNAALWNLAAPGGTTGFLRADGTWATPPGTYVLPQASSSVIGGVFAQTNSYIAATGLGSAANYKFASSNSVLSTYPSSMGSVLRYGVASIGDSHVTLFTASGSACSLNSGAGDVGSQVPTSDGKCWLAAYFDTKIFATGFGALGNGSSLYAATNTTALNAAISAGQSYGVAVVIPGGPGSTYYSDQINYTWQTSPASLISVSCDPGVTIQKATSDGNPLVQIGNDGTHIPVGSAQTGYLGPVRDLFSWCSLYGIAGNTPNVVVSYNIAQTRSVAVGVFNATAGSGWMSYGGVDNVWDFPKGQNNSIGMQFLPYMLGSTAQPPNQNTLNQPNMIANLVWGLYFSGGMQFVVNQGHIENTRSQANGSPISGATNTDFAGAIYCGGLVGYPGCTINGGWFEQTTGTQNILLASGLNIVRDIYSNNDANITYDIAITGGSYMLSNNFCGSGRTNVNDSGSTGYNVISSHDWCSALAGINYETTKISQSSLDASPSGYISHGGAFPTMTNGLGAFYSTTTSGAVMAGSGSVYDFLVLNSSNAGVLGVPHGTNNIIFFGTVGLTPVTWTNTQTCTTGQISVDTSYIYVCTAANVVKRAALVSF